MKQTGKRTLGLVLVLAMLLTLTPGLLPAAHADAKNVGVNVSYAVGDTVVLPGNAWFLMDDNSYWDGWDYNDPFADFYYPWKKELTTGSYPVMGVTFISATATQGKITWEGTASWGTYPIEFYVAKPAGRLADEPIGFKVASGSGTEDDPYVLALLYESTAPTTFTVYFNNGGGAGGKDPVTGVSGEYELPANPFTYPGYDFAGWQIGDDTTDVRQSGEKINVTANVTLTARWTLKDLTLQVGSGTATFNQVTASSLTGLHMGDVVTITAGDPPEGQEFVEWRVTDGNGSFGSWTDAETTYTMGTNNVSIFAYYQNTVQTCVHEEGNDSVTLTAWSGATPLPNVAGNYCLTADVALSSTWVVPAGVTRLCLYNHNITMTGDNTMAIYVPAGATLYLYGHDEITSNATNRISCSGTESCAVLVDGGTLVTKTVKLYGSDGGIWVSDGSVTITHRTQFLNNTAGIYVNGGSVSMDSGFMQGCTLGVAVMDGSFSVTSGTVSGAAAAVYVEGGSFKVGNYPTIDGKVYLKTGTLIGFTNQPLDASVRISVEMETPGVFTNGMSGKATAANFTSANPDYYVTATEAGEAQLGAPHVHDWSYTLNNTNVGTASVIASCTTGCDVTEGLGLTLTRPNNLSYNGNPKAATLSTVYSTVAFPGNYVISYSGQNNTVYGPTADAPTDPGDYRASVEVEGVTASVDFTITGTLPHNHNWNYEANGAAVTASCTAGCPITDGLTLTISAAQDLAYNGSPKAATLSTGYNSTAFPGNYAISYSGQNNTIYGPTANTPTDPGDYRASVEVEGVTASVDFTITGTLPHNHNFTYSVNNATITATCNAEGCTLTNSKAALTIVAPTLTVYGGTGSAAATLTGLEAFNTATGLNAAESSIVYYYAKIVEGVYKTDNDKTDAYGTMTAAPIDAGDYLAKITVSGCIASVGYTIAPASLSAVSVSDVTLTYSGSAQTPDPATAATAVNGQAVSFHYSKTQGDYGDMPTFTTVADSGTVYFKASAPNHSDVTGSFTVTVNRRDQQAPAAPTKASATVSSITLVETEGCEYSKDGTNWQDSPTFTGLDTNTSYTFYQRLKGDDNNNPSEKSAPANISTNAHVHNWNYEANGAAVTASCTAGCPITDGLTLTLSAPQELAYNGSPKAATLSTGYNSTAFPGNYAISYSGLNNTVYGPSNDAPTDPGDYRASVEIEGVTASVDFTITGTLPHNHNFTYEANNATITATCTAEGCDLAEGKATLTVIAPEHAQVGDGKSAAATLSGGIPGQGTPSIVYKQGETVLQSAPTAAGSYTASITLGGVTASVAYQVKNVFTVSFVTGLTPEIDAQRVVEGERAAQPVLTVPEFWEFVDWYTDGEFSALFDFSTPITADTTVFAKWIVHNPAAPFAANSYALLLGRQPTDEELNTVANALLSGQMTAAQLVTTLCDASGLSGGALVAALNTLMLEGGADTDEWTATLEQGVSPAYIIKAFSEMDAFRTLCANCRIQPGTVTLTESRDQNLAVTAFVQRCYRLMMGRDGDVGGLNAWTQVLLNRSVSGAALVDAFAASEEFQSLGLSNEEQVAILYNVMLNRQPDAEGLAAWTAFLDNGCSLRFIIAGFAGSGEFGALCQASGILPGAVRLTEARDRNPAVTGFVQRCYRLMMGRDGDVGGLNAWTNALLNRSVSGVTLVDSFLNSQEFQGRALGTVDQVEILYLVMMDRPADNEGRDAWAGFVDNDQVSMHFVVNGFGLSQEFTTLCQSYGIVPGSLSLTEARDRNLNVTRFVNRCYSEALGSRADVDGLNAWCQVLLSRSMTPQQVARNFVFSQECQNRGLDDTQFITMLYHLFMGREPDNAGLVAWVNYLGQGATREVAVNGFAQSIEFRGIVASYGL